jgi:hypothetical protein
MGKDNFMENVAQKFSLHEETSGKVILHGHLVTMYHPVIRAHVFNTRMYMKGLGKCTKIELIKLTRASSEPDNSPT